MVSSPDSVVQACVGVPVRATRLTVSAADLIDMGVAGFRRRLARVFEYLSMERRKHWWNGTWGRLARRDVYLFEDAGHWWVESREGGADGRAAPTSSTPRSPRWTASPVCSPSPGDWRELR